MLNERMVALGTQRSVIRELFEFGKMRAAEVGAENIFDFSIGNPSVPSPGIVNETAIKLINEVDPVILHGYTSAVGSLEVRNAIANYLNEKGYNVTNYGTFKQSSETRIIPPNFGS